MGTSWLTNDPTQHEPNPHDEHPRIIQRLVQSRVSSSYASHVIGTTTYESINRSRGHRYYRPRNLLIGRYQTFHLADTGLASALLGLTVDAIRADRELFGKLLETFVYQELRRQSSWQLESYAFHRFRDKDGSEVDVVIEQGGRHIAGIEVKASATVIARDFSGLIKLREAVARRFAAGVVLYDGELTVPFGDRLYAVPIRALWET